LPKQTQVIRLDANAPEAAAISIASRTILAGGLVAFPTETVYGLGANALDAAAVAKIFAAKGRPGTDPLIAHIAGFDQLPLVARDVPDLARKLAQRFWPGPLTLVLKKSGGIPDNMTAGLDTVALRLPDHPVALALLRAAAVPIAAPSANKFSRPSPTCAQHVLDDLAGLVDILLDAGPTSIGVESTILSLVDDPPRLLRPGGVSLEALRAVCPALEYAPHFLGDDQLAPAPGAMLRHYSPRARLLLFAGDDEAAVSAAMRAEIVGRDNVGLLASDADALQFADLNIPTETLGSNAEEAALRLFAAMRALDRRGLDTIVARAPKKQGLGLALWDRLLRAAAGSIVEVT